MNKLTQTTVVLVDKFGRFYASDSNAAYALQFLTTDNGGLSMTEANTLKNAASAAQQRVNQEVHAIRAHSSYVRYDGADVPILDVKKMSATDIKHIIGYHPPYHGLSAWLAEAIGAKSTLLTAIKDASLALLSQDVEKHQRLIFNDFRYPEFEYPEFDEKPFRENIQELVEPQKPVPLTEEQAAVTLFSSSKYAEYLSNEAQAAVLGGYIHKGGPLYALHNTSSVTMLSSGEYTIGDKVYPVQHKLIFDSIELQEHQEYYEELRKEWARLEASVNWFKKQIHDYISQQTINDNEKYQRDHRTYDEERAIRSNQFKSAKLQYSSARSLAEEKHRNNRTEALEKYESEKKEYGSHLEANRAKLLREASSLKVFIPEELRDLVDRLREHTTEAG